MNIYQLTVQNFRNLTYVDFNPSAGFNIIYGANGSGKTSLLEAIGYLAFGRSIRQARYSYLINNDAQSFVITAKIHSDHDSDDFVGIERSRNRQTNLKININSVHSSRLLDLVDKICVQIIYPDGIELVSGGPEFRRNFLDWGVFYTYPEFRGLWLDYRKLLSQRNSLLKSAHSALDPTLFIWDDLLVDLSHKISDLRRQYVKDLVPLLKAKLSDFLPQFKFDFIFNQGWDDQLDLASLLRSNLERDRVLGYTYYGCQRADLKIKCDQISASEVLSRGQLKLLVCALRLTQGLLLSEQAARNCIFLIDDISSELDSVSRDVLLKDLSAFHNQVFLTNISKDISFLSRHDCNFIDIKSLIQEF